MKKLNVHFLKHFPLFNELSDENLKKLLDIMQVKEYEAGSTLIRENDLGSELFILLDGEVDVSRSLILKVSGKGLGQHDKSLVKLTGDHHAFFGEMGLFDEKSVRSATVTAHTKSTVAILRRSDFFELAEKDHEIGYHVFKNLLVIVSERLAKTTKDVLKLTTALSLALDR